MTVVFWIAVGLLLYAYLGYPLLLCLLLPLFGKRIKYGEDLPTVSLIIAAYNEEKVIEAKLQNSLELDYPAEKLEIVVVSESTDSTDAMVERFRQSGVKLLHFSRRGKPAMLFAAVPQLSGEIVIFSDANAMYVRDAIRKLVRNFADPRIGCVSGQLKYGKSSNAAGANEGLYWRYEMGVKRLESRLFHLLGTNGSIFAIRKSLYHPISETQGDDFEISIQILISGSGVILEPEAVSLEEPSTLVKHELFRRVRNVGWASPSAWFLLRRAISKPAPLVAIQLISHKFLRWLLLPLLLFIFISSAVLTGQAYRILLLVQGVFYILAGLGWLLDSLRKNSPALFRVPYYFCALHLGALWGLLRALGSPHQSMWSKVR